MKFTRKIFTWIVALMAIATVGAGSYSYGQNQEQPAQQRQDGLGDPIRRLNLTPDQLQQIRTIRQQTNAERATVNRRLGDANRALEEALDSDTPDEASVEHRMREVSAAQAEAMRMRVSTEVKIRRVLTLEQRVLLRSLRQQAQNLRRERIEARDERQRRRQDRVNGLRNQRGIAPLGPAREPVREPRP